MPADTPVGAALEAEVARHIGEPAEYTVTRTRDATVEDLLKLYGTNAAIAEAAGYGTSSSPEPSRQARRSFMRNLQRWREGGPRGGEQKRRPSLRSRVRIRVLETTRVTPQNVEQVLELMERLGVTMTRARVLVIISKDSRVRDVRIGVYIDPGLLRALRVIRHARADNWDRAAARLLEAWRIAYGLPGAEMSLDTPEPVLTFAIGDLGAELAPYRFAA